MENMKLKRIVVFVMTGLLVANVVLSIPLVQAADTGGKSYTLNNHEPDNQHIEVPGGGFFDPDDDMVPNRDKMTAYGHYTGLALLPEDGGGVTGDFDLELYEDYDFEEDVVSSYRGLGKMETVVVQQPDPSSETAYFGRVLPYQGEGYSSNDIMNYVVESDSHSGELYGTNPDNPGPLQVGETRSSALIAGSEGGTFTGDTTDHNGEPPLLNVYSAYLYEGGNYNLTIPRTDAGFDMNLTTHIVSGNASIPQESLASGKVDETTGVQEDITYFTPSSTGWYGIVVLNHNRDNPGSQEYDILLSAEYDVTASPLTRLIAPGMDTFYDVDVTAEGAVRPIDMDYEWVGGAPNDVNVNLADNTVHPQGDTLNETKISVETSDGTAPGEYTLRVWGNSTSDSGLVHHTDVELVVEDDENFYITGIPDHQKVGVGTNFGFDINVTAINNFNNDVNLSVSSVSPPTPELTYNFEESTLGTPYPNETVLDTYTTSDIQPDTYELTVRGEGGGIIHNTTVELEVTTGIDAQIYSPLQGEVISGEYTFQADASYTDGSIDEVELTFGQNMSALGTVSTSYSTSSGLWERTIDTEGFPDGISTVKATAIANDGTIYSTDSLSFETKNTPPNPVIVEPSDHEYVNGSSVSIKVNTSEKVNEVRYQIDDQAWSSMYNGPPTWDVIWDSETVSDGLHEVTVEAKDEAGLEGQSSTKIYVDNNEPSLDIVSPVDNETIEGKYKFQALAEDTVKVDRVNITVFGSTTSMIYNEVTGYYERTIRTSTFSDGNYTASMAARDKVGHTTENRSVNFQVANTPPSMTIHSPKSGEILNGTHTLRAEVESDFLETVEYRVNDGGWEDMEYNASLENYTAEWDTTAVPDGPHSLTFKAVDEVGHVTEVTREIEVDNNPPTGSVIEPLEGEFIRDKYTFKISARDAVGVSSVGINVFNGTYPGSYNEVTGYYEYSLNTESIEDGNYSMNATVEDEAGWTYTTQDVKFKVDNSAPGVSIERPRPNIYVNDTVEINATITDRFIQDADYRIDEGSWNEMDINGDHATVLWETANFTEGSHRIDVRAADKAGHSTIDSVEVIVDNKAPTGAIASPYSGEYVKDAFTFQVSASDENGINEVRVDVFGQSYSTEYNTGTGLYEITLITSSMEDGTYDISAEIEDNAGWRTHLKNVTFHVNNEGPTLSILEPEPGMILSGVTEVRVNATDDFLSLVRYRIDNSEWRSMESTNQVWTRELDTENHTDGEHRLQVEAIDDAGLTASQSIRIKFDNTRPEGSIIAPSDGDFVGGRLALQVTAEDAVGIRDVMVNFEQVEGENASDIHQLGTRETFYDQATGYYIFEVASFRYTDGLARFNATVIDEAGFRTKLSTVEFYIDNNEPEVNYENLGQGDFVSGEVNLTVEVNDGPYVPKVDYRIDNRTWNSMDREGSVWTSLWDTTGVGDGTHTITVRARDDAGHTTRNKIDVTVDNHAPQIDILNPVPDQFVEEDVSVQIRATDEVGIETVMVDMNALVGEKPSADNWSLEATLNPSTGYYEATLDTTLIGSDGYWNVTAEAMDTSGKNTMTRTIEFRVVNHDPDLTIHSPRHGDYISSEVDINVTVDHPFTTWAYYSIDDEGWNGVNESWKTSQYSDGEHNLAIKGETVSGNQVIRNIKVIVDNNDPTISVISPVEGQFVEDWVQFRVKAKDQVGIDEVEGEIFNSTKELSYDSENGYHVFEIDTRNFDDGNYTFNATVVDLIGNTDKTETITFQVDNNAPVVDIESPQNGEYVRDTIELNVTVEDEFINEVRYSVDDTGFVPISAELNTTRLSDGEHTITVKATDKAGHTTDRKVSVIVDNIAPAIRLHTPRREEVIRGSEEIKAYVDSEVQDVTIEFPGVGLGPLAMEKTSEDNVYGYVLNTTELTGREGSGTFMARVSVQDVAGHNMTKDFQITIDNAGPQIEMIEPVKNLRNKTTVKGTTVFTLNVSSLAGAEDVQINIDGRGWNNMMLVKNNTYMYQWETEGEEDGEYTYVIRTEDKAGNVNQYSGTMKVDNPTDYWGIFQENLPGITFLLIIILLIFLLYLGRNEVRDRMKREEEEPDEGEEDEESSEKSSGWISSPFKSKEDKDKGKDKEKHLQKVKKKKEAEEKERKQEEEGTESQDEELEADKIDQPIDELDLDDKIVARLESEGIVTIEDLTEISGVELTEIDGIGQKRAAKIGKRLNEAGFSLKAAEKEEGKGLMESVMDAEVPSQKDE